MRRMLIASIVISLFALPAWAGGNIKVTGTFGYLAGTGEGLTMAGQGVSAYISTIDAPTGVFGFAQCLVGSICQLPVVSVPDVWPVGYKLCSGNSCVDSTQGAATGYMTGQAALQIEEFTIPADTDGNFTLPANLVISYGATDLSGNTLFVINGTARGKALVWGIVHDGQVDFWNVSLSFKGQVRVNP